MRERPPTFRINRNAALAKGLVFAGLGGGASTLMLADASGYGNHGTLTNMDPPTDWVWVSELGRWCITCDGSDDYAEVPYKDYLAIGRDATAAVTVSAWVRQGATNRAYESYMQKDRQTSSAVLDWVLGSNTTSALWGTGESSDTKAWMQATSSIVAGQWIHLCGTLLASDTTTGSKSLYVNGVSKASGDYTLKNSASTSALEIGGGAWPALADIADTCFWRRVLSPAEIQQLADPSNVLLSGLIDNPRRKLFPAVSFSYKMFVKVGGSFVGVTPKVKISDAFVDSAVSIKGVGF